MSILHGRVLGTDDTVNSYQDSNSLINTLSVNSIIFAVILVIFEIFRHIKIVFLKRLTKKFISTSRVPPLPPKHPFGWIVAIANVSDDELIRMVGLDAYMLLRYIIVCFR